MKTILFVFIFSVFSNSLFAQIEESDSLAQDSIRIYLETNEELDSLVAGTDYKDYNQKFYLVNSLNQKRKIKNYPELEFELKNLEPLDSGIVGKGTTINGYFLNLEGRMVRFDKYNEETYLSYPNNMTSRTTIEYSHHYDEEPYTNRDYDTSVIDKIKFQYSANEPIYKISKTLMYVSAFTMLVLAPAINYNYKSGNFNENRYLKMVGYGFFGLSVSLPFRIILRRKTNYVVLNPDKRGQNIWRVVVK